MSYTPINWQTGDVITAEKLNKMDNDWGVQNAQLFSESVTTAELGEGVYGADMTFSQLIDADTIIVTFDGTNYRCNKIDFRGANYYGGFSESGPDFSVYPFAIGSSYEGNSIYTETSGTYTVSASSNVVEYGEDFTTAVSSVNEQLGIMIPLKLIENETKENEAITALESDRLVFFKIGTRSMFFVSSINTTTGSVSFTPEADGVTAGFDAETGNFFIGGN